MNKKYIACGDIVIDKTYPRAVKGIVIAHSVNGVQPLIVAIEDLEQDKYRPCWHSYSGITEILGHIDIKKALVNQIPQKPIVAGNRICYTYSCPVCGNKFTGTISKYCYHCGQALDWTETEEKL